MNAANPYIICISDHDLAIGGNMDHALSCKLADAGFDIGPMLWTASPPTYSQQERQKRWKQAMAQAGIVRMETGHDAQKGRTWFKVWHKDS